MTCRELADFIDDYLAGELGSDALITFERHLSRCPNCRSYLSAYKATVALGRQAFDDGDADVPTDVPNDLVQAILAARRSH